MENLALISTKSPNPTFLPSKQCLNRHFFISKPTSKSLNFAFSAHNSHAHISSTTITNYNENTNTNARNFDGVNVFASTSTAYTPLSSSSKFEVPLFWIGIGVGVGLSAVFSILNSRLKNNKMQDAGKTTIDFGDDYLTLARKLSGTTIDISHLCKTKNKVYLDAYIKEILPGNPPKTNADSSLRSSSEEAKSAKKGAVSKEATSSELPQEKEMLQNPIYPQLRWRNLDTLPEEDILELKQIFSEMGITYEEFCSRLEASPEFRLAISNPRIQQAFVEIGSRKKSFSLTIKYLFYSEFRDFLKIMMELFPEFEQVNW